MEKVKRQEKMCLKRKSKILIAFCIAILLVACKGNYVFDKVVEIENGSWHADEPFAFNFTISDTLLSYDVLFHLRNNSNYQYSNIWFFIETSSPNGVVLKDTVEYQLADASGQWLGSGLGDINSMLLAYKTNIRFPLRGVYTLKVKQAMREEELKNIIDLGLRIKPHK